MEHKPEKRRMKLIRPIARRETAEDRRLAPMMRALKAIHSATLPESMAPEDLELLKVYFQEDMSLQNTSSRLFLHKNSLQYKLNRIGRLCGYNPRSFRQAAVLYMSLKLMENEEDRKNR